MCKFGKILDSGRAGALWAHQAGSQDLDLKKHRGTSFRVEVPLDVGGKSTRF